LCFKCDICNFSTNLKTNYNRHLNTKKHINNAIKLCSVVEKKRINPQTEPKKSQKEPKKSQKEPKKSQKEPKRAKKEPTNKKEYKCMYCCTFFKTYANKRRHELHRCNQNINKLLNEKNKQIKKLEKTVDKLIDKAGNTTITHIKNNQNNIKLNNYGSEDLSHISELFKTNLLLQPHGMIPKMIEAVHFNENKPENKNIVYPNKNENKIKIFSGDKWVYKNKNETLNELMDGKYFIMDAHYETICNNSNTNLNLYKNFQHLFDTQNKILLESQKKECELILLNNR